MIELCLSRIPSRSKYDTFQPRSCQLPKGHAGNHEEFPYLQQLRQLYPSIAEKIKRDATMTTGAA